VVVCTLCDAPSKVFQEVHSRVGHGLDTSMDYVGLCVWVRPPFFNSNAASSIVGVASFKL